MVPKLRTSLVGRRPAVPRMTQATTEPWCTSSPAARSISASIATSRGGGRGAAGRKTEAGPRAGRTNRSRHAVVPERWLAEFGQGDKWRVCLKAAMMPRIRSEHDEADPPDTQSGLQGEGGIGGPQRREDAGRVGAAV